MKLSHKIDLEPLREKVLLQIDNHHAMPITRSVAGIHAVKLRYAQAILTQGETVAHPVLNAEAQARGVSVTDLANTIIAKDQEHVDAVMVVEVQRLTAKSRIAAAASEQELKAIFLEFGGHPNAI